MSIGSMSVIESRPTNASVSAVIIMHAGGVGLGVVKELAIDAGQTFKYLL